MLKLKWNKKMHQYESDESLEKQLKNLMDISDMYILQMNHLTTFVVVVIVSYHMCNVLVADFTEKVKFAKNCALENIQCLNHQKRM